MWLSLSLNVVPGAYFTDPFTIPLCLSAHGRSPSHIYHLCTHSFMYNPQPVYFPYNLTLMFSHNLTTIIFIAFHPHPCIQYIHRFDAYTHTHLHKHTQAPNIHSYSLTLPYFVLRICSHKSLPVIVIYVVATMTPYNPMQHSPIIHSLSPTEFT